MFIIILILSVALVWQIVKYKLYTSSIAIFYWFVINCFVTPAIYYSLVEGEVYKKFCDTTYMIYLSIGCIYLFQMLLLNTIFILCRKGMFKFKFVQSLTMKHSLRLYVTIMILSLLSFAVLYRDKLPLLYLLINGAIKSELERPDVSGSIPHFFSLSTWFMISMPMIYLYYKVTRKLSGFKDFVFLSLTVFSLLIGGNKATLVYFIIFMWIYCWKFHNLKAVLSLGVFSMYIYLIFKRGFEDVFQNVEYMMESPLRRFFVTQGAMFINRIELLINSKNDLMTDGRTISNIVYEYVYSGTGGSAPCFYVGDFLIEYGLFFGMILSTIVLVVLYIIAGYCDKFYQQELYVVYGVYYILFCLGIAPLNSSFILRCLTVVFLFIVFSFEKRNNEYYRRNVLEC